tara:strand:+ start:2453 stop:3394 length:942 start_codon:yes stop_codon:yes gene_type:complete
LINSVEILRPGIYSSVQDLRRIGYKKYGIPSSGPMDEYSHILVNWVLGKNIFSETIEITFFGPKIKMNFACNIAIYGSSCEAYLNQESIKPGVSIPVEEGDVIDIQKCIDGNRVYLAFSAKMKIDSSFDSVSTYDKIKIGGVSGKKLSKGDIILFEKIKIIRKRKIPQIFNRTYDQSNIIRIIEGIHFNRIENISDIENKAFKISNDSDRMAVRLCGNKIKLHKKEEIESTVVNRGCIQIPRGGEPIVLMSDSQSTGGYPILGYVCRVDISKISQIQPNKLLKFKIIPIEESYRLIDFEKRKFKSILGLNLSP